MLNSILVLVLVLDHNPKNLFVLVLSATFMQVLVLVLRTKIHKWY